MSTTLEPPGAPAAAAPAIKGAAVRRGDRVFVGLSRGAGILILVTMAAIAVFLIWKAIPSLQANTANFFTTTEWSPDAKPAYFGIAALVVAVTAFVVFVERAVRKILVNYAKQIGRAHV